MIGGRYCNEVLSTSNLNMLNTIFKVKSESRTYP
jgi:hypothetical protein